MYANDVSDEPKAAGMLLRCALGVLRLLELRLMTLEDWGFFDGLLALLVI